MAGRGKPGPNPDFLKREAFAEFVAQGFSVSEACRRAGINRKTGKRWLRGRVIRLPDGRERHYAPVVNVAPVKTYSPRYLSLEERIRLADLRRERRSMREIAALMGRSASTISRELRRGADVTGRYRPHDAQHKAIQRRRLHRPSRLARDQGLREWVSEHLLAKWSPEQISHELRSVFPSDPSRWLAAETIYQAVYRPDLGGLPRELPGRVLRRKRRYRYPHRSATARRSGPIVGGISVSERPKAVLERAEPGHWEGDLIVGTGHKTSIVTLVERTARYTLLGHLPAGRGDSASVRDAVVKALAPLPAELRRTLTWDRGTEMSRHLEIAHILEGTRVYFCDPHSPWQRPSNEHTNGMLRDYFPKGTDLSLHDADELERVQHALNARPRGVLDWDSPARRFATLMNTPSVLQR